MNFIEFLKREFSINIEPAIPNEKTPKVKLNFKPLVDVEQHKDLAKVLDVKIEERPENEIVDLEDEQADNWQNHIQNYKEELVTAKKEVTNKENGLVAFLDKEIKLPTFSFKAVHYAMVTVVILLFAISAMMALPTAVQKSVLAKNNQAIRQNSTKVYVNDKEALSNFIRNNNEKIDAASSNGQVEFAVSEADIFNKTINNIEIATSVAAETSSLKNGLDKVKTVAVDIIKSLSDKQKEQSLIINNTLANYFVE